MRLALGARRSQLLRQLLMGKHGACTGGWNLWSRPVLMGHIRTLRISSADCRYRLEGFGYTFALSVLSGLLIGVAPAWAASRPVLSKALKGEDAFAYKDGRWSLRDALLFSQMFLSLVLLCATGLFLRSLQSASRIDIGFHSRNLLLINIDPQLNGYSTIRTTQFLEELRRCVGVLPGVTSVACVDPMPLSMDGRWDDFTSQVLQTPRSKIKSWISTWSPRAIFKRWASNG